MENLYSKDSYESTDFSILAKDVDDDDKAVDESYDKEGLNLIMDAESDYLHLHVNSSQYLCETDDYEPLAGDVDKFKSSLKYVDQKDEGHDDIDAVKESEEQDQENMHLSTDSFQINEYDAPRDLEEEQKNNRQLVNFVLTYSKEGNVKTDSQKIESIMEKTYIDSEKKQAQNINNVYQDKQDEELNGTRPLTTSTIQDWPGGLTAKPNTPASQNIYVKQDIFKRGGISPSSDQLFTHSMSTIRSSQSSGAGHWAEELFSDQELRFGVQTPHYFFIQQSKPSAMPPLPVWRGYKGNVYFEPISITKLNCTPPHSAKEQRSQRPHSKPYRLIHSSNQVYVLDKQSVYRSINERIRDELKFIEGVESTGSLAVRPASALPQPRSSRVSSSKTVLNAKQKIRKGSNFHSSKSASSIGGNRAGAHSAPVQTKQFYLGASKPSKSTTTMTTTADPKLVINGGKLSSSSYLYPTARSPTVLSFNTQIGRRNTPDLSEAFEKFPALERVSSVDLEVQEEVSSARSGSQSRTSNVSEDTRRTTMSYTPKVQVRRLTAK